MKKISLVFVFLCLIFSYYYFNLGEYLNFEYIKSQQQNFKSFTNNSPLLAFGGFFLIYILVTAVSLPGAALLTLLAGALFGLSKGTIVVSLASTIGATLSFLSSRYLFKEFTAKKFATFSNEINKGIQKDGGLYLFTLRLIPAFPFFLINILMGLTSIRLIVYFWVSLIGMLPGTLVYVNAGKQLGTLNSVSGILTPQLIFSFCLLGLFPLLAKKAMGFFKKNERL